MTQGRYGGRGQVDWRGGCSGRGCAGKSGCGKSIKLGLYKELKGHVFDYGGHSAADIFFIPKEKIQLFIGVKYVEDMANELKNWSRVIIV